MHKLCDLEMPQSDRIVPQGQATAAVTTNSGSWQRSAAPLQAGLTHFQHSLTRALPGLQRVRQAQDGRVQQQLEALTHLLVAIE